MNLQGSESLAFTLDADLKRAREPQNGDFKAGDGAILSITAGGYADKIIVRFPDELTSLNPELNKEYIYEFPEAIKTEQYEFNIPLATPGGEYVVEVESWKNDIKLSGDIVWCRPEKVCIVEYMPNTLDVLRQPVFKGIRDDV